MTPELGYLAAVAILALIHPSVQGLVLKAEVGNRWTIGARDSGPERPAPIAARAERAMRNFLETLPAFVTATLVLHLADLGSDLTRAGSLVYLVGRAIYLPAYMTGIPWFRTLVWNISTAGLAAVILGIWWQP